MHLKCLSTFNWVEKKILNLTDFKNIDNLISLIVNLIKINSIMATQSSAIYLLSVLTLFVSMKIEN